MLSPISNSTHFCSCGFILIQKGLCLHQEANESLSALSFLSSPILFFHLGFLFLLRPLLCKLHLQSLMVRVLIRKEKLILSWFPDLYKNKEQYSHPLQVFLEGHLIHPCHCLHQGPVGFIRLMDCSISFQQYIFIFVSKKINTHWGANWAGARSPLTLKSYKIQKRDIIQGYKALVYSMRMDI